VRLVQQNDRPGGVDVERRRPDGVGGRPGFQPDVLRAVSPRRRDHAGPAAKRERATLELDFDCVTHRVGVIGRARRCGDADPIAPFDRFDLRVVLEALRVLRDVVRNGCAEPPHACDVVFCEGQPAERPSGSSPNEQGSTQNARPLGILDTGLGAVDVERQLHAFAGHDQQWRQMRRLEQRLGCSLLGRRDGSGS
jgi:hypothetical protein